MDLQCVGGILQLVRPGDRLRRQLSELSYWCKPGAELQRDWGRENKPARLHGDHDVDRPRLERPRHELDHVAECAGITKEGGNVVEENALPRKIGDLSYFRAQGLAACLLLFHGSDYSVGGTPPMPGQARLDERSVVEMWERQAF